MPTKTSSSSSRAGDQVQMPAVQRRAHAVGDHLGQVQPIGLERPRRARPRPAGPGAAATADSSRARDLVQPSPRLRARSRDRGPPSARWARTSTDRLPRHSASACASASVDVAAAHGLLGLASAMAPIVDVPRRISRRVGHRRHARAPCRSRCYVAAGPARRRRWRRASKQTTAQATPTLSDSAFPAIGMATAIPSRRARPSGSPADSLPRTSAVGTDQSTPT